MRIYPVFLPLAGCPHRCLFCRQEGGEGRSGIPSPQEAETFLDQVLPAAGEGEVAYFGGTFTLLPPDLQRAYLGGAGRFVHARRVGGIRVSTRPDALGADAVALLVEREVTTVEIGCQSFSETVLRRIERGHSPGAAKEAVRRLRSAGMSVGLQLMPGLPGADAGEAIASLKSALALRPDFLRIYPAVVFRGTGLEGLWRQGAYRPFSLSEAVELCADLLRLCRQAAVPVIRLGLQGTAALESDIVAGPWHPAFGQMVRARLWLKALRQGALRGGEEAAVHPSDLSDALGHRRENLHLLREMFPAFTLTVDPALPRGEIAFGSLRFDAEQLAHED